MKNIPQNLFRLFSAAVWLTYVLPLYLARPLLPSTPRQAGFFVTLLLTAVFAILSDLLKPKPEGEGLRPSNIGDFRFPTAQEGRVIPLIWGTVKLSGPNVIWYGDLQQVAITEKVKTGMFSSDSVTTGFRYNVGIQYGLCRGPIEEVTGVWIGEDRVFTGTATSSIVIDKPTLFGGDDMGNGGVSGTLSLFLGSPTQLASSYLSPFQQEGGDTPAYRGTAYAVWERGYVGNSSSIKAWSFEVRRMPNGLGLITATNELNGGTDVNPMSAIYELLTDTEWGLGLVVADIDTTNFTTAATTLAAENNGFSMSMERSMVATDFLKELERQVDGVVFFDRATSKWKINLARPGQSSIGTVDETNLVQAQSFSRAAWEDTTNQVRVKYSDRSRDYFETYALAQDMANFQIQGNNVAVESNYPGVKDPDLANDIAWRDLRTLSRPLARATLVVNRDFWDANIGDILEWTDATLGVVDLVMRITKVNIGELAQGRITLQVVEDIFSADPGSFAKPQPTGWVPPVDTVVDIPAADRIIFEAPKAFVDRDPSAPGLVDRIWGGARSQGKNEVRFDMGVVGGSTEGTVVGFLLAGKLNAAVTRNSVGTIVLKPDPDTQSEMVAATENVTDLDKGISLSNLAIINGEFIFIDSATVSGLNVNLNGPTRGILDTVSAEHAVDDVCYLLYVSGNITDGTFANPSTVSMELLPESPSDRLTTAAATNFNVTMADRTLKPYPPVRPLLTGVEYDTGNVNLDAAVGATDDGAGYTVDFTRRDFRTADEFKAQVNETTLPSDFPSANTTEYRVEIINDPDGTPTSLFFTSWLTGDGTSFKIGRTDILANNSGAVPSRMQISVETRHTVAAVVHTATQKLTWDFNTTSALLDGGDTNLGTGGTGAALPTPFVTGTTGSHTVSIGSDILVSGTVQENVNSGGWVNTGIALGTTSVGRSYTAADSIQYQVNGEGVLNLNTRIHVDEPTVGDTVEAYGVFTL